jgi:ankyrin repeat protein
VERGAPINDIKYEHDPISYVERKLFGLGTPLHQAAELGKRDIVNYLLEQGADPLKLDSRGKTPRFWAESKHRAELACILKSSEDCKFSAQFTAIALPESMSVPSYTSPK